MSNTDKIREELEELSPFLSKMKGKGDGMKMPEGYFDQLSENVLKQIHQEGVQEAPVEKPAGPNWLDRLAEGFWALFQPRLAVAFATVALLLAAGWFLLRQPATELDADELESYIVANLDGFDTEMLMEVSFENEDWNLLQDTDWNDEAIEEYLEDHLDEIDDLDLENLL